MSGGSYNYLFCKDFPDLNTEDLEAMEHRLRGLGATAAADRTKEILDRLRADEDPVGGELRRLWQDVEWRDSGDIGDKELRDAVDYYERWAAAGEKEG